jgi:type II secretory pathway component PulF
MSFFVLPKIIPLFEGLKVDLPATTKMLILFSHLIQNHGLALFIGLVAVISLLVWYTRQKFSHPVTHWILLKTPILKGIVRNTNLSRFCGTLATLLKGGLNIDEALEITKDTLSSYYFKKTIPFITDHVTKGGKLSEGMAQFKNIYPKMVTRMIEVGEKSGTIESSLFYLSDFFENEVDTSTKSLSTAIEPILLIFIGLVVAFLALSIITPIYQITGSVHR